ncbi:hypothetical protein GCM10023145_14410 [Angustibacter luteus]
MALALAALWLGAPAAQAEGRDLYITTTDAGHPAAFAWFYPHGEHWGVCDDQKDGKRAIVYLKNVRTGTVYTLFDDNGYNNTCSRSPVNFNLAEGTPVALRVCLRDGALGPFSSCSAWTRSTA